MSKKSRTRQSLVRAEIVQAAARVFADHGFRKATLNDVAERLEISRATLYHYIDGKEDLLQQVLGNVSERHAALLAELEQDAEMSPTDKLATATRRLVLEFGNEADVMRVFLREEVELPPDLLAQHRAWKASSDRAMRSIIEQGVQSGEFRAVDARATAFAVFGMINWLHVWFRPDGALSLEEIADSFADLITSALVVPSTDAAGPAAAPAATLEQTIHALRAHIDLLDQQIQQLRQAQRASR